MRQLFPEPRAEVDLAAVYGSPAGVRVNMIASADGGATVGGTSGGLGGPADKALFAALRSLCDVVLVAAGTMRAERYGPVRLSPDVSKARQQRGQSPVPPIAVLSRAGQFDFDSPFFTEAAVRPIIITVETAAAALKADGAAVADIVVAGETDVDLQRAVASLDDLGLRSVLCEGGPSLNGQLVAHGLVDELCLTVAPLLVGGDARRITTGPDPAEDGSMTLASVLEEDGYLFLRYIASKSR